MASRASRLLGEASLCCCSRGAITCGEPSAEVRAPRGVYTDQWVSDRRLGQSRCIRLVLLIVVLVCGLTANPALAHRLQVFASANGDLIEGSAYFAGGAPASGVDVLIETAGGEVLAQLSPAADGSFSYRTTTPAEYVVVAHSGDGHRAEWAVRAVELAPAYAVAAAEQPTAAAGPGADVTPAHRLEPGPGQVAARLAQGVEVSSNEPTDVDPALIAALELAVARQLRPLREELAAARSRAGLRDVLGGVGYIFGLAGLVLWWRARV